ERRVREGDVEGVDVDAGAGEARDLDRQQLGRRERRAVAEAAGHAEGRHAEFDLGKVRVVVVGLAAVAARELPADGLVGVHEHGLHRARAIQAVGAPAVVDEAHVAEIEVGVGGASHVARLGQRDAALIDVAGAAGRARAVGAARAAAVGSARAGAVGAAAAGATAGVRSAGAGGVGPAAARGLGAAGARAVRAAGAGAVRAARAGAVRTTGAGAVGPARAGAIGAAGAVASTRAGAAGGRRRRAPHEREQRRDASADTEDGR